MGNITSALSPAGASDNDPLVVHKELTGAYAGAMEEEERRGGYAGGADGGCGCGNKLGGADGSQLDLKEASEYVDSINSKSKTRIIESILEATGKLGMKPEGSNPAARIKSLLAQIPSGDRFKRDDKVQEGVCRNIAKAINAAYGVKVIAENMPADALCQQIAEILSSLGAGVHTEFLAVYNDVQKVLHNLRILEETLVQNMNQIKEKATRCEDGVTAKNMQLNYDLQEMLLQETKRQIQLLSNLLNVHLMPTASDLSRLLKDKKELHGWIKKINLKAGEDKFGRVISDLLRGLGLTANFMLVVEQALQTVGLTMSEYKNLKNIDQLRAAAISKGINLTGDDLHKFNDALELLEKNLSRVKYTPVVGAGTSEDSVGGKGSEEMSGVTGGLVSGSYADNVYGGADYPRSTMDKRVEDRKKLRNLIYSTFVRQLNEALDKFVGTLDVLSMKIGIDIPISDQLDGFRQALSRVNVELSRRKQIYLALIGYYNDAMSKSKRDQVVGEMKMIISFVDSIIEMPMYRNSAGYFQAVKAQAQAVLDIVGKYADDISAKFGRGELVREKEGSASLVGDATGYSPSPYVLSSSASPIGAVTGAASPIGDVTGHSSVYGAASPIGDVTGHSSVYGADDEIAGGALNMGLSPLNVAGAGEYDGGEEPDIPAPRFRATKTLNDAVRQFDYKFRVAQIRGNLARSGAELSHYGEKYEKLTANSLADLLKKEQAKYKYLSDLLDKESNLPSNEEKTEAKKFLDAQWEAKKKFWAAAEALDGYMLAFTNGFVNHPNDIKDIRSVLDDIEVIRDWYTDRSGNQLSSVFDHFPNKISDNADGATNQTVPTDKYKNADDHYYETVKAATGASAADVPGDHRNVTLPSKGVVARTTLKTMLNSMTALKNLLSVFVNFGSKFGGNDLNKATFLTPAQLYNNLLEYLQASAFQQGHNNGAIAVGPDGKVTPPTDWNKKTEKTGVSTTGSDLNDKGLAVRHWGVWMRSIAGASAGSSLPTEAGTETKEEAGFNFRLEDEYFVIMMKSIAAKILTVTGMYDVLDRPYEFNGITPIRMIMGGDIETPKVEEGAVALYLRLPLLCQFWRTIFNFDEGATPDGNDKNRFQQYNPMPGYGDKVLKISMVPDMDGTFAGLIRLLFRKHRYLDTSAYSDDDIKEIIRECNLIYQKMSAKHSQNAIMETIYELIAEVNRRYGVVSQEDRNKYEAEFGYRYDYSKSGVPDPYGREPNPAEIALLPGEDEEAIPRPSGAERLLEGTDWSKSEANKLSKYGVLLQHKKLINNFRCAIDKFFESPNEQYSFNGAIKSTQQKLKRETRDEERFKIVASLVRGVDVYSKVDGLKYLLFHETVIAGLNILSGFHSMLSRFQAHAQLLNIDWLVEGTIEYLSKIDAAAATISNLVAHLAGKYAAGKGAMDDTEAAVLLALILGDGNNEQGLCASGFDDANAIRPTADMTLQGVKKFDTDSKLDAGKTKIDGKQGLAGVLNNIEVKNLKDLFYNKVSESDKPSQKKVHCFFRYLLNREFVMKDILESLFGLSSDLQGLVEVRIDDGKLYMNTGGLKGVINELFEHVGYFIELMRPHINKQLIYNYTDKLYAGSLYWLQEQLLEKIIIGRPPQVGGGALPYYNIDDQMRGISNTYQWLTREFNFSGTKPDGTDGLSKTDSSGFANATPSRNAFDKVFASMIFYDAERPGSGLLPSNEAKTWDDTKKLATNKPRFVSWATDPYEALHLSGPPGAQVLDIRFASRFYQLYSWRDELTLNRSALFVFNQLVAKFVQSFYDVGQKKMYKGLIDQFANGTFNRAIVDHRYTYPDVVPAVVSKFSGPEDLNTPPNILGESDPNFRDRVGELAEAVDFHIERLSSRGKDVASGSLLWSADNAKEFMKSVFLAVVAGIVNEYRSDNTINDDSLRRLAGWVKTGKVDFGGYGDDAAVRADAAINSLEKIQKLVAARTDAQIASIINERGAGGGVGRYTEPHENDADATKNSFYGLARKFIIDNKATLEGKKINSYRNLLPLLDRDAENGDKATSPTTIATVVKIAMQLFPYSSNVLGNSDRDANVRKRLFTELLIRVAEEANNATDANAMKAARMRLVNIFASRKVHSAGRSASTAYLIKNDDLAKINTDRAWDKDLLEPSYEDFVVQYARKDKVVNGVLADSIDNIGVPGPGNESPAGLKDHVKMQEFGNRADPDGDHVLFTSLAVVIRNIVNTRTVGQTQNLVYMTENIADVPIYMKEKMRANLPAFKNLFRELANRCEFLKKFMMRREMNLDRHWQQHNFDGAGLKDLEFTNPWPWQLVKPEGAKKSDDAKMRFAGILDTIVRGSQTLINACDSVLKEVGDDPKYLELYSGSIRDYRAQYGVDPLMPVSSMLSLMNNVVENNELDFFPIHSLGELHFKLMYGSRSLLQNMAAQPTAESVPGWNQTVESFNLMVDGRMQADKNHCDGMLKALVKGVRYLYDLKRVKGLITPFISLGCAGDRWWDGKKSGGDTSKSNALFSSGSFIRDNLVSNTKSQIQQKSVVSIVNSEIGALKHLKSVFGLTKNLSEVVMLTESSNKDDQLKNLVDWINTEGKPDSRNSLAVQNIIDLNIIPINVHALMRDIPLANLYNYAYTYDRLIIELFYGLGGDSAKKMIQELCGDNMKEYVRSPKDMLVALLLSPYINLNEHASKDVAAASLVQGMLLGATGEEGIGRPKFLSDQIYGKAIFGELYAQPPTADLGPAASFTRPDKLQLTAVRMTLANTMKNAINRACGGSGTLARQGGAFSETAAVNIATLILKNQTIGIGDLLASDDIKSLAGAGSKDNEYKMAVAIICKAVATAYLWALDAFAFRGVSVSDAAAGYKVIVDDAQKVWDGTTKEIRSGLMDKVLGNEKYKNAYNHVKNAISRLDKDTTNITEGATGAETMYIDPTKSIELVTNANVNISSLHNMTNTLASPAALHYLKDGALKTVDLTNDVKGKLIELGGARFDTVLIRNLVFVVNLYRSVRMKLQQDLTYSKDIVTKSLPITRMQLTEFAGNRSYQDRVEHTNVRYE